jgi:hypothetical protein
VKLREGELAPLGDVAPIKAFVLLRRGTRRTRLEQVSKNEMLKEILLQNFAHQVPPVETLDRLMQLTEAAACYRLRYDKVSSAALLLRKTFAAKKTRSRHNRSVPPEKRDAIQQPRAAQAHNRAASGRFRRVPWVEAREVGNEFFLAAPRAGAIHHLDPMASAAWRILDQPRSSEEMVRLFQAVSRCAKAQDRQGRRTPHQVSGRQGVDRRSRQRQEPEGPEPCDKGHFTPLTDPGNATLFEELNRAGSPRVPLRKLRVAGQTGGCQPRLFAPAATRADRTVVGLECIGIADVARVPQDLDAG